jgi:hypothetical protein
MLLGGQDDLGYGIVPRTCADTSRPVSHSIADGPIDTRPRNYNPCKRTLYVLSTMHARTRDASSSYYPCLSRVDHDRVKPIRMLF